MSDNIEELKQRVAAAEERATKWEKLYAGSTIRRALLAAATEGGAVHPTQLLPFLEPKARLLDDNGKHVVRVVATGADGKEILHTPEEAIGHMRKQREHENLFQQTISQLLTQPSPVQSPSRQIPLMANGKVDVRKLTPTQYREIRATNPELLGLRPKSKY